MNEKFITLSHYEIEVVPSDVPGHGIVMEICAPAGTIIITKKQAKEFFGLSEASEYDAMTAFHFLWTKCVGKPGYNKETWVEVEKQLIKAKEIKEL